MRSDQEIGRFRIPLRAESVPFGEALTGGGGVFKFQVPDAAAWPALFQAWYTGDDRNWPAYAEVK